jgi:hypothetical protein
LRADDKFAYYFDLQNPETKSESKSESNTENDYDDGLDDIAGESDDDLIQILLDEIEKVPQDKERDGSTLDTEGTSVM